MKQGLHALEEALRYLKHRIKQPRSVSAQESSTIDHDDEIESLKQGLHALEEALRYFKHKNKQLKPLTVQDSSTIDHEDEIDSMKRSIDELKEAFRCLKTKSYNSNHCQLKNPHKLIIIATLNQINRA